MVAFLLLPVVFAGQAPRDIVVSDQPSKPVHVKVGQRLIFSVYSNPSTGANWTVKDSGKPGLVQTDVPQPPDRRGPHPPTGSGSNINIGFVAVKKGNYSLTLVYGRSWELKKGATPWEKRSAKVIVE